MFDRSRRRPATEVVCGADAVPVEHDRPTGSDRCRSPSTGAALATACSCGLRSTPPGGLCTSTGMHFGPYPRYRFDDLYLQNVTLKRGLMQARA